MIQNFGKEPYLEINPDIKEIIENGEFDSLEQYMDSYGVDNIEKGLEPFHKNFEPFDEIRYLESFSDVKDAVDRRRFDSAFHHFCDYGYKEIIDGIRTWPTIKESSMKASQEVFGNIEKLSGFTVTGWVGTVSKSENISVEVFIDDVLIATTDACLKRQDVIEANPAYKYSKGFNSTILLNNFAKKIIYFLENSQDVSNMHLVINGEPHPDSFKIPIDDFLKNLASESRYDNFLSFVPYFGTGIEKYFSVTQILDTLYNFDNFNLAKAIPEKRNKLINEILVCNIENDEKEKLLFYLTTHQDVLEMIVRKLDISTNEALIQILKQALHSINYLDAWQIIENLSIEQKVLFDFDVLEAKITKDKNIEYLFRHPGEIIITWRNLNDNERIEQALTFMGLFVSLQNFNTLKELELSLEELSQISNAKNKLSAIEIQQYWLEKNPGWEGMIVTAYLLSLDFSSSLFIDLSLNFIENLSRIPYIYRSFIYHILSKIFLYEYKEEEIIKIMNLLQDTVNEKSIWDDKFIKMLYTEYTDYLLSSGHHTFFDIYKLSLQHYLLDKDYVIDQKKLSFRYFTEENIGWIKHIESFRNNAIVALDKGKNYKKFVPYLDTISYTAPNIVEKIKFEILQNNLNYKITKPINEFIEVGGNYDNFLVSKKLKETALSKYYETKLISDNIQFPKHSANNYWYKRALSLRQAIVEKRLMFLEELFQYFYDKQELIDEEVRLVRLLLSEIAWSIEKGLDPDSIMINKKTLNEVLTYLEELDERILQYSAAFRFYIEMQKSKQRTISKADINYNFESTDYLAGILKLRGNKTVSKDAGLQYLKHSMLFPYTLVMIYSCQAYMNTRQQVIRETWLQRVKELGIEYKFIVGGIENSKVEDDIVYVSVDDTYENLPQKSVEMFRFVEENFSYDRYMKLDDDCFLNVDAYFSDDALYVSNFYGRFVHRAIGGTDRVWHQKKSQSIEAQEALDLSPEPSYYADGSTGYVLTRYTIKKLLNAYDAKKNKALVNNSFLEDKLVGDLLTSEDIKIDSTNFTSVVYRKLTNTQEATFWEYNIWPKIDNDVKILHSETAETMRNVWKSFFSDDDAQKQYFSNHKIDNFKTVYDKQPIVEEISINRSKIKKAKNIAVVVCQNEFIHLPALLEHHRNIGIEHFIYIDNISSDESLDYMMEQEDVSIFATTQSYKNYRFSVDWLEVIFANFCYGKWILVIDADEFFVYDDFENKKISVLTDYADEHNYDSFLAPMVDMYNQSKLSEASIKNKVPYAVCNYFDDISSMTIQNSNDFGPFSNSVVYSGGLRKRVFGAYNLAPVHSYLNQKYCLFKYKPTHKFIEGIHFMGNNNPAPIRASILHFKYHAGFFEKVQEQIKNGQHWNGSQEYKRYLKVLEQNPELSFFDENVSLVYMNSQSLVEAGYMDKIE